MLVASVAACFLALQSAAAAADANPAPDIVVFERDGCPRCAQAERFLTELRRERPALRVEVHDVVADPAALARLRTLTERRGVRTLVVPAFLIGDELVLGFRPGLSEHEIEARLGAAAGRTPARATPTPASTGG